MLISEFRYFKGQYPWIAALGYRFPNTTIYGLQFQCAGSLITLTHVLTTAHCISDYLYVTIAASNFNNFKLICHSFYLADSLFVWANSIYRTATMVLHL